MHKAVPAFTIQHYISRTPNRVYSVTHACPVRTHENATVAEDALHRGRSSRHIVNCADKSIQILSYSLEVMHFRIAFGDAVADSRYDAQVWPAQ